MLAGRAREPDRAVGFGRGGKRRAVRVALGQRGDDALEHPGATQVQAVEVRELAIRRVGTRHRREPARGLLPRRLGQETLEPRGELRRREHAAHKVRLAERRREEIVARGLPGDRRAPIGAIEVPRALLHEQREALLARGARPVEREPEREGGLAVLAAANRPTQLRQPVGQPPHRECLERAQRAQPVVGDGAPPLAQLGSELEQPRQPVGPLEALAPGGAHVGGLAGDALDGEAQPQRLARASGEGRGRAEAHEPRQAPVPVHRGVPVERAAERGGQLARRAHVVIAAQEMHGVVRVLPPDGGERHLGEAFDLLYGD